MGKEGEGCGQEKIGDQSMERRIEKDIGNFAWPGRKEVGGGMWCGLGKKKEGSGKKGGCGREGMRAQEKERERWKGENGWGAKLGVKGGKRSGEGAVWRCSHYDHSRRQNQILLNRAKWG